MPTEQPNNAADTDLPADARDPESAAAVLRDEQLDDAPGGGGLGGLAAASGAPGGSGPAPGGTSPNSPIDVPIPASTLDEGGQNPSATREARDQALSNTSGSTR